MNRLKFFFFAFIRLPSTILHELLHASAVFLFTLVDLVFNILKSATPIPQKNITKIVSFNLIPDFKSGTLGSVGHINSSPYQSIIISLAPLLSWILLAYLLVYFNYIDIDNYKISVSENSYFIDFSVMISSIYLVWSGTLSRQDVTNAFKALFTFQVVFIIAISYGIYYFKDDGIRSTFLRLYETISIYVSPLINKFIGFASTL